MKARTTTKKVISLLLAAIMVLSLIPMSTLVAFAEETDGNLTIGASDAAGTVYTIYGAEDWKTVSDASAAGNLFKGMTVKLGKDIGGTKDAPLTLDTLFTGFAGTFDGNGKSISYVNITATAKTYSAGSSSVNGAALIAVATEDDAVIKNLTLSNVNLTTEHTAYVGMLVGGTELATTTTISGITVTDCTVTGVAATANMAAMIGRTGGTNYISNCTVTGTTVRGGNMALGLVIGFVGGTVHVNNDNTSHVTVSGTVYGRGSSSTSTGSRFGAFSGAIGNWATLNATNVDIENATVAADPDVSGAIIENIGGITGYVDGKQATVNVKNGSATNLTLSAKASMGAIVGRWNHQTETGRTVSLTVDGFTLNGANYTGGKENGQGANVGGLIGMIKLSSGDPDAKVSIKNVILAGAINLSGNSGVSGVIGTPQAGDNATNQQILIDGITVTGTLNIVNHGKNAGGTSITGSNSGIIAGWTSLKGESNLTIKNVTVAETATVSIESDFTASGIVSSITGSNNATALIENISLRNTTIVATQSAQDAGVAGVIAQINQAKSVTVKNVTVNNVTVKTTDENDSTKNVAGVVGRINSTGTNIVIDGVATTGALKITGKVHIGGFGGVVGWYAPASAASTLTVKNLDMNHLDMDVTFGKGAVNAETNKTREWQGVGGVIGFYVANTTSAVSILDSKLGGTLDAVKCGSGAGSIGGLIGKVTEKSAYDSSDYDNYAGTITVKRVEMLTEITNDVNTTYCGTGAIIGSYGQGTRGAAWQPDVYAPNAVLEVSDVYIGGNVTGGQMHGVAGIMGWANFMMSTVKLNNVIFAGTLQSVNSGEGNRRVGLILGRGLRGAMKITMLNCSAVNADYPLIADMGGQKGYAYDEAQSKYALTDATVYLNGVGYTAVTANPGANQFVGAMSLQRDSVATVTAEEAASMVNYNNGKLTSVDGHLTAAYEQHTEAYEKAGNQVYDIRFIALSHVALTDGYTVTVRAKTTENTTDKDILFDNLKCEAYTSLKGYNGLTAYEYTAAQLNGKSFIAVVLTGIPAGVAYDFEVVASYTTESGITMTDIVRTLHVAADGTFSSTPVAQ